MELAEQARVRKDKVPVSRKALEAVLEQCQLALQQLASGCDEDDDDDDDENREVVAPKGSIHTSDLLTCHTDTVEFCDLLKLKSECADFLTKIENVHVSPPENTAGEAGSWDMVSEKDTFGPANVELEAQDYVLVRQEDVKEGIASFMAAYLLSLEQTKDLTQSRLQEVLNKTFSMKKKKGKLRKAWDRTKIVYNVASWGATAIGVYQSPVISSAATITFGTSSRVLSKLW